MESFVKSKITEYQDLFQIEVLFWFVRKSTIRGLGRKASDLDLVFIYRSMNPGPVKILFLAPFWPDNPAAWRLFITAD